MVGIAGPFHKSAAVLAGEVLPPADEFLLHKRNTLLINIYYPLSMADAEIGDFQKLDIRVGRIVSAEDFPEARKPSYKLKIDFGPLGIKRSSAQITTLYHKEDLIDKVVIAVVNFPPRQVANFISEVLVLGVVLDNDEVVLLQPEREVPLGKKIA
jgi:tRNA-binding protein